MPDPITAFSADGVKHEFAPGTDMSVVDRVMKEYATTKSSATPSAMQTPTPQPSPLQSYLRGSLEGIKQAGREIPEGARDIAKMVGGLAQRAGSAEVGAAGQLLPQSSLPIQPGLERLGDIATFVTGGRTDSITPQGVKAGASAARDFAEHPQTRQYYELPGTGLTPVENKARNVVERTLKQSVKSNEITAEGLLDTISNARSERQPLTLADVGGKPVEKLARNVYTSEGPGSQIVRKFFEDRDKAFVDLDTAAGSRVSNAINRYIRNGDMRETAKVLKTTRSENAQPLWEEALRGGSIAPLETQFENAFNTASKTERESATTLTQVQQRLTNAIAKQSTANNVYSSSAANREVREAQEQLKTAQDSIRRAGESKNSILERLRQAQADGTANAKGAIWSPRIQEFLDHPDVQQGLRRGWKIERNNALAEGRQMDTTEYAVVSIDKNGDPVVGKVPNMKLLKVAKQGLDAILNSKEMRNEFGSLNEMGRSIEAVRDAFVAEIDSLNPAYKIARDAWTDDTNSMRALRDGREVFDSRKLTPEELSERWQKMPDNDKEFYRLGVADKLKHDLDRTRLSGDESKAIINSVEDLKKIRVLFDDDTKFNKFVDFIKNERLMFDKSREIMKSGGGQESSRTAIDVAHAVARLFYHNPVHAVPYLIRTLRDLGVTRSDKLNAEIAKLLVNPDITLTNSPSTGLLGRSGAIPGLLTSPPP